MDFSEPKRELRPARVPQQHGSWGERQASVAWKLVEIAVQPGDERWIFAGDLGRILPVAIVDSGRYDKPAINIGRRKQVSAEIFPIAAHAVQGDKRQ
jgi:hypothetical protein